MTSIFPVLVAVLEFCAGVVYAVSWWQGNRAHGALALVWLFYGVAAAALATVGER
jgi:hypothetical protein